MGRPLPSQGGFRHASRPNEVVRVTNSSFRHASCPNEGIQVTNSRARITQVGTKLFRSRGKKVAPKTWANLGQGFRGTQVQVLKPKCSNTPPRWILCISTFSAIACLLGRSCSACLLARWCSTSAYEVLARCLQNLD